MSSGFSLPTNLINSTSKKDFSSKLSIFCFTRYAHKMKTNDFDYKLPKNLIAQTPLVPRDTSRLMVVFRDTKRIVHDRFFNLEKYLTADDVLVFNESKVMPARLHGKKETGGKIEVLLLKEYSPDTWESQIRGELKVGGKIIFDRDLIGEVFEDMGLTKLVKFNLKGAYLTSKFHDIGEAPLPPYIKSDPKKFPLYQTIYAREEGSAAAPTAGFHFTERTFRMLKDKKIPTEFVTLHVGLGTYNPVKTEKVEDYQIHAEYYEIDPTVAEKLNLYKKSGKEITAVGTTSLRTLESAAERDLLTNLNGDSTLFIYPGYEFKFVDHLLTNFHLPKSSLLMLVAAFAEKDFILEAYQEAIREKYRFFSFGDAMLIL